MVETRRNRKRDTEQRESSEKGLQTEKVFIRLVFDGRREQTENEQMCAGECEKRGRQSPTMFRPEHLAQRQEKATHICDGNKILRVVNAPLVHSAHHRQNCK